MKGEQATVAGWGILGGSTLQVWLSFVYMLEPLQHSAMGQHNMPCYNSCVY